MQRKQLLVSFAAWIRDLFAVIIGSNSMASSRCRRRLQDPFLKGDTALLTIHKLAYSVDRLDHQRA